MLVFLNVLLLTSHYLEKLPMHAKDTGEGFYVQYRLSTGNPTVCIASKHFSCVREMFHTDFSSLNPENIILLVFYL